MLNATEIGPGRIPHDFHTQYTLTLHRNDGDGTPRMTWGWRHNHPPPACCQVDLAHRLDRGGTAESQARQSRRPHSMINPESPPPPVEPEVKDARRTHTLRRTTTPRQQRVHPHHRPLVGTTTCSRRQIGGPDHAGLWPSKPARPTTTAHLSPSWPVLPTQARGRLRIRARAILDCMCCDVPQSTPHTSAGNACRWARRCGLVMESLTHETADPSPSSTRTTTPCAPPASRIFDSIGFPLSVSQSITCSGNPASSIPTSLSTRWWAIDRRWAGSKRQHTITGNHLARRTAPKAFGLGHGFYQQRGSLPTTLRGLTTMTETRRHRQP